MGRHSLRKALICPDVIEVLRASRSPGIFTKSTIARSHADAVAEAASRGWITTEDTGAFGRIWLITPSGLTALNISNGVTN